MGARGGGRNKGQKDKKKRAPRKPVLYNTGLYLFKENKL